MSIIPAFSKFSITKDLLLLINANVELIGLVGENIYPIVAPEKDSNGNDINECIIYYREKLIPQYVQNTVVSSDLKITYVVISKNYSTSITMAELLNDTIEGLHQNSDGYNYRCRLVDSDENVTGQKSDIYMQILTFEIK